MRKILTLAIAMMITVCCFTQENWFDEDSLSGLPVSSLFSKAVWHKAHNHADTAMGFYLLIVRKMSSMPDTTSQRFCAQSCVELGNIYFEKGYYTEAFTSFTTAIKIAENNRFEHMLPQIYNNIGKIYCTWNDQTRGIEYFKKGLKHADRTDDVESYKSLLINILGVYISQHMLDEARQCYDKLAALTPRDSITDYFCLLNKGLILREEDRKKEAIISLTETADYAVRENMGASYLCSAYNYLADTYESTDIDSALYFLHKSIEIAGTPLYMQRESLKKLSNLYRRKNDKGKAARYAGMYLSLSDSLFKEDEINRIKDTQLMYEIEKTYNRIDRLNTEKQEKENQLRLQRKILITISVSLLCVITLLVMLYRQKKKLHQAYQSLFQHSNEMLRSEQANAERRKMLEERVSCLEKELSEHNAAEQHKAQAQEEPAEQEKTARRHSADKLTDAQKENILAGIERIMTNTQHVYDCDFSIERLADLTGCNSRYISQVINETYHRNFRSLVNEYRIKEAQKRLLDVERYGNYTIQAIAQSVGYKSHANFILLFKKQVGIPPSLFQKMAKEDNGTDTL